MIKKLEGYLIIFILALASAGFFYVQNTLAGQNILISQIQITGGAGKTENDFVELYNPNNSQFNLKNYRLVKRTKTGVSDTSIKSWTADAFIPANGYYLWANSGYANISATPDATTTATISDDNGLAIRFGAADSGAIIDGLAWGKAQNAFIEGSVFPTNPGANQSLARKSNLDTNNNSADFFIQENSIPKNSSTTVITPTQPPAENSAASSAPEQTSSQANSSTSTTDSTSSGAGGTSLIKNKLGDVVINELVSDPADNEVEWLELYNKNGRDIDLTGWWLEDGSGAKTKLSGILAGSGVERYKVIEQPVGNLNNGGDLIILYDSDAKIIDRLAYGNWNDGVTENNAPAAGDPNSLARKFDGYDTYNNLNDFAVTIKPTKGASNIIQVEDEVSAETKAKFDFSNDIFISEILPNPDGDDAKLEFIEIYNAGRRRVDLTGWSLANQSNKKVNLEKIDASAVIQAGEYLALYRPKTKIVLSNDQGQIKLFQPLADKPLSFVNYKNATEGLSYNKNDDDWFWSETPTPGSANIIKTVNHAPEADFSFKSPALVNAPVIFDGSDTVDQDGDKLEYTWNFGDGLKNNLANPEHAYLKVGIYKVTLEVNDGHETTKKEKSIKVVSRVGEITNVSEIAALPPIARNDSLIIINEIFPNPKGSDAGGEWLELKNQGSDKINFLNWRVENSNGKYEFNSEQLIAGGAFYVLKNSQSKLMFKNSSDVINLYNNLDELADTVEYAGAVQGESYARGANGHWFWTTAATPGTANVIKVADSEASLKYQTSITKAKAEDYAATDLEKVRELEIGSLIKLKGTVAVEPGILGAQIFYIVGSPGLQVYNYKKDFPALKIGDYVEVAGELAETQGELRIKTKDKADIKIDGHKAPPTALAISSDQASEDMAGRLVTVTGEITDKKSSTLYLDDGHDEILIYIKKNTGITTKALATGQTIAITGILSKTAAGLRLMPRYQSDLVKLDQAGALKPQVLGEVASAGEWDLTERNKKLELFKYLLIIAGGMIIVLIGLFIKASKKRSTE